MGRRIILSIATLLLIACSSPADSPTSGNSHPGEIWYTAIAEDGRGWIHRSGDGERLRLGNEFAVSPDYAKVAVLADGSMSVAGLKEQTEVKVADDVMRFWWGGESGELLYVARDPQQPRNGQLRVLRPSGEVAVLGESTIEKLYAGTPSPLGSWFAYYQAGTIALIDLETGDRRAVELGPSDSTGVPRWADDRHLSIIESSNRLVRVDVETGNRQVVAALPDGDRLRHSAFTPDGDSLVILGTDALHLFRDGREVQSCTGSWTEASWAPDGQTLLLKRNVGSDWYLDLLTGKALLSRTCQVFTLPHVGELVAWHPSKPVILVKQSSYPGRNERIEVMEVTESVGKSRVVVGEGTGAGWIFP